MTATSLLTAAALTNYLSAAGWQSEDAQRTTLWVPPSAEHADLQVALPKEGVDYSTDVLDEAARVVAYVEGFTLSGLVNSVVEGGADTLSVRLLPPKAESGVAPLALAQESIAALRSLIIGAAAALKNDSLVLPSKRPALVEDYAAKAKVSTRPGSFIWDVALPLNVEAERASPVPEGQDTLMEVAPQPYGRRVSDRIRQTATNATALAQRVLAGEAALTQFAQRQLRVGNAMEIDALASLGNTPDAPYQLRLTQSAFARRVKPVTGLSINPDVRACLHEAAEFLRTTQPQEDVTVEGLVVRLFRRGASGPGDVTIHAILDDTGKNKACVVNLSEEDYAEASRAHMEGFVVVVKGDLTVSGTHKRLVRASQFHVVEMAP